MENCTSAEAPAEAPSWVWREWSSQVRPGGQGKQAKNLHRINYDSRHKLSPIEATTLKTKEKTEANFLDLKARTALETQLRNPICPYDSPDMASPHNTHTHTQAQFKRHQGPSTGHPNAFKNSHLGSTSPGVRPCKIPNALNNWKLLLF